MNAERIEKMRARIEAALQPSELEIKDFSAEHAGHVGARDGRGHFAVTIVAQKFEGFRSIARHRMVYDAVGDMMQADVHALTIDARTPDEQ